MQRNDKQTKMRILNIRLALRPLMTATGIPRLH